METANVYSDTNKSSYEYDLSKSFCIRNNDKNIISKTISNWSNSIFGSYIVNDELIDEIREIVEKRGDTNKCKCMQENED